MQLYMVWTTEKNPRGELSLEVIRWKHPMDGYEDTYIDDVTDNDDMIYVERKERQMI